MVHELDNTSFPGPAWGPQDFSAQAYHYRFSFSLPSPFSPPTNQFLLSTYDRKRCAGFEEETQMNLTWVLPFRRL